MTNDKDEHIDFQKRFFDENVDIFKKTIPADVIERSREITSAIVPSASARILDVGTGIGAFLVHYHELGVAYSQILGCDLSTEMLNEARRRFPQVRFWQGDVINLPASFGTFDLIVFNACFGNIFDQENVIRKNHAILNERGRIAISHPMGNSFVAQLQAMEPNLVHSLLPARETLLNWCEALNVHLKIFRDEEFLYLALLEKSQ